MLFVNEKKIVSNLKRSAEIREEMWCAMSHGCKKVG